MVVVIDYVCQDVPVKYDGKLYREDDILPRRHESL